VRGGRAAAALLAALAASIGTLAWQALSDPAVPFLAGYPGAEWIVYPTPASALPQPGVELDALFRRRFVVAPTPTTKSGRTGSSSGDRFLDRAARPANATLRVRWLRRGEVRLNGALLAVSPPDGDWKRAVEAPRAELAHLLRSGENVVEVRAWNASGPPAAWLSLTGEGLRVATDRSWEASLAGASWRPASLATTPMDRRSGAPVAADLSNPGALAAARANLPRLALFAILAAALVAAGAAWERRRREARDDDDHPCDAPDAENPDARGDAGDPAAQAAGRGSLPPGVTAKREPALSRNEVLALLAGAALLWGALFWHDRHLSPSWGFDFEGHHEYLQRVLDGGPLPLADEGWEMYQPPLYYLVATGLLRLVGHPRLDPAGVEILRGLGWAAGMLQLAAVLGALRLLFADRRRPVLAGFVLALFLPVELYMFLYVTNEALHAALASLALFLALRILDRDDTSARSHLALGAVLGLAMLAKFSALLTFATVIAALAGRLAVRRVREPRVWLRTVGAAALAFLAVCGWHYARVALHFGKPLIGNWDPESGFRWWQQPGYATAGTFLRFGRSLSAPLFSGFNSLPDGLYSTFWGDGLLGGAAVAAIRPPWDIGLMAAGYLLALVPSLVLLAGFFAALRRAAREPRAGDLLMLGVLGLTLFAIVAMTLKLPFYAQPKAFYGLAAMTAIAAMTGYGAELLAGRSALRRALLYILLAMLATWAINSYATFWIAGGDTGEPTAEAFAVLDPEGLLARSGEALRAGRFTEAAELARAATARQPDHPLAWPQLGVALAASGRTAEAIAAFREALRIAPADGRAHAMLAALYQKSGESAPALYHARYARLLENGFRAP
jgi:tetratricopeptide repeat protein/dolichyl-phosphate-mannose-protein mannosyltransferase